MPVEDTGHFRACWVFFDYFVSRCLGRSWLRPCVSDGKGRTRAL